MIKMKKLISESIKEGLIYTADVRKAIPILKNAGKKNKYDVGLRSDWRGNVNTDEIIVLYNFDKSYDDPSEKSRFSELIRLANNLGYYPSFIEYLSMSDPSPDFGVIYNETELKKAYTDNKENSFILSLSKKFDSPIKKTKLPKYIYHLTYSKYHNKIKTVGLTPHSHDKKQYHPERIYLCLSRHSVALLRKFDEFKKCDMLYTIDTSRLPDDIKLYKDPAFADNGIYTEDTISPHCIVRATKRNVNK